MSQQEVLDFLKRRPNELFTSSELNEMMRHGSITQNLKKLMEFPTIPICKFSRGKSKVMFYAYCRKLKKLIRRRGKRDISNNTTMVSF